jgi:hypothetical protein
MGRRFNAGRLRQPRKPQAEDPDSVHRAAAAGVRGSGSTLPHFDRIQQAFGGTHDLSQARAHVGGEAAAASDVQLSARSGADAPWTRTCAAFPEQRSGMQSSNLEHAGPQKELEIKVPR